jgi:hypothetical protein
MSAWLADGPPVGSVGFEHDAIALVPQPRRHFDVCRMERPPYRHCRVCARLAAARSPTRPAWPRQPDPAMTRAELWRAAATSIARFWTLTRNQVFRELPRLQAQGLIEAAPPRPRRRQPYRSRRRSWWTSQLRSGRTRSALRQGRRAKRTSSRRVIQLRTIRSWMLVKPRSPVFATRASARS